MQLKQGRIEKTAQLGSPNYREMEAERSVVLNAQIVTLSYLGVSPKTIAEDLGVGIKVVNGILNSTFGKMLFQNLVENAIKKSVNLREEYEKILVDNLEVPVSIIKNEVYEDVEEMVDNKLVTTKRKIRISPMQRMKAYKEIGVLAGYGAGKTDVVINNAVTAERLTELKNRAKVEMEVETVEFVDIATKDDQKLLSEE